MKDLNFCYDWLSFTIKLDNLDDLMLQIDEIVSKLKIREIGVLPEFRPNGRYGYNKMMTFDDSINVLFNVGDYSNIDEVQEERLLSQGVHIEFTGQGCRLIEKVIENWADYLNELKNLGVEFSRLDIALDDYVGKLDLDVIDEKIKKGEIVSYGRSREIVNNYNVKEKRNSKGERLGKTIYINSRQSSIYYRFYDKKKEQEQKGIQVDMDVWLRYEMVLKKEKATDFIIRFIDGEEISDLYLGVISNSMRFVEPNSNDSNKRRWPTSRFWEEFVKDVKGVKLIAKQVDLNLEKTIKWLDGSVINSLLLVKKIAEKEGIDLFEKLESLNLEETTKQKNILSMFDDLDDEDRNLILYKIENIGKR